MLHLNKRHVVLLNRIRVWSCAVGSAHAGPRWVLVLFYCISKKPYFPNSRLFRFVFACYNGEYYIICISSYSSILCNSCMRALSHFGVTWKPPRFTYPNDDGFSLDVFLKPRRFSKKIRDTYYYRIAVVGHLQQYWDDADLGFPLVNWTVLRFDIGISWRYG